MSWTTSQVPKKEPEAAVLPHGTPAGGSPPRQGSQQLRGGRKGECLPSGLGILLTAGKATDPVLDRAL